MSGPYLKPLFYHMNGWGRFFCFVLWGTKGLQGVINRSSSPWLLSVSHSDSVSGAVNQHLNEKRLACCTVWREKHDSIFTKVIPFVHAWVWHVQTLKTVPEMAGFWTWIFEPPLAPYYKCWSICSPRWVLSDRINRWHTHAYTYTPQQVSIQQEIRFF